MSKYKQSDNLAYAINTKRTVTVKRGNTIKVKDVRRLRSENGRQRRKKMWCLKTKETMYEWLKPWEKYMYYRSININIKWRLQMKKSEKETWVH